MYKYKGHTPGNKETRAKGPKQAQQKAQKQQAQKQELNKSFNKAKTQRKQTNSQQHKNHPEVTFQFIAIRGQSFKLIEQSRLRIVSIMV